MSDRAIALELLRLAAVERDPLKRKLLRAAARKVGGKGKGKKGS